MTAGAKAPDASSIDVIDTTPPHPRPGESIQLTSKAPPALWFDEVDGGWLQLDQRITRDQTTLMLQVFRDEDDVTAFWVLGCAAKLCDVVVGEA